MDHYSPTTNNDDQNDDSKPAEETTVNEEIDSNQLKQIMETSNNEDSLRICLDTSAESLEIKQDNQRLPVDPPQEQKPQHPIDKEGELEEEDGGGGGGGEEKGIGGEGEEKDKMVSEDINKDNEDNEDKRSNSSPSRSRSRSPSKSKSNRSHHSHRHKSSSSRRHRDSRHHSSSRHDRHKHHKSDRHKHHHRDRERNHGVDLEENQLDADASKIDTLSAADDGHKSHDEVVAECHRSDKQERRDSHRSHRSSRHRDDRNREKERDRERDYRHGHRSRRSRSRSQSRSSRHGYRSSVRVHSESPISKRNARTIFVMQLAARVTSRDLDEFFSSIGKVREVRLIMDTKTRRHKGIAYIEFQDASSIPLAFALNGQRLCGASILIQPTQAEKNRQETTDQVQQPTNISVPNLRPSGMRIYIGSLHPDLTEDMLRSVFEPFGQLSKIELIRSPETGKSRGYGFVTFYDSDDANKAIKQLNGFELAGKPIRVSKTTERSERVHSGNYANGGQDKTNSASSIYSTSNNNSAKNDYSSSLNNEPTGVDSRI